jgi:nucleotide-binding universal stress UspA family protein
MYSIVVAVDGSETAVRAMRAAIELARLIPEAQIRAVNVQPAIPASVGEFVGGETVRDHYLDEAEKAFVTVRALLAESGIPHTLEYRTGSAGETVADFAREADARLIVMGTRGLSAFKGLVMGSVATKVVQTAPCPVVLVK